MAEIIRMPRLSDTMEEGVIIEWHKKVGDTVSPGDVLAEVETDKATMDLESFESGVLLHIGVEKGAVPVDGILAVIGQKGEDFEALLKEADAKQPSTKDEVKQEEKTEEVSMPQPVEASEKKASVTDGKIKASPLAKKMAADAGIPLSAIKGSGDDGRIIKRDVVDAMEKPQQPSTQAVSYPTSGYEDIPLSQMRKTIARRLGESKFTAPHFYLTMKIDMTQAISARKQINEMIAPDKVSFNDMIVKAVAAALKKHPQVNSSWLDDKIRINYDTNIGVAVAIEDGLVVPVINHADKKSLTEISAEVKDKATRAKNKQLGLDEMQGNTFTISNLGMFGIDEFTAIINPPDACILAVGGIEQTPVVKDGNIVIGNIMKVTLSCDHRAVDGAVGSSFLKTLKALLESPVRILA